MSITRFEFEELDRGWRLEPVTFDTINLLVGVSGVGKSRILSALTMVARAARRELSGVRHVRWMIGVQSGAEELIWEALVVPTEDAPRFEVSEDQDALMEVQGRCRFVSERVTTGAGRIVVERDASGVRVEGVSLALKESESVVSLLRTQATLQPLYERLSRVVVSSAPVKQQPLRTSRQRLEEAILRHSTLESLRVDDRLSLIEKAYVLDAKFSDEFKAMEHQYCNIFPYVSGVWVDLSSTFVTEDSPSRLSAMNRLELAFKEEGVKGWVLSSEMSTGMYRTLIHLLELTLLPPGSVILIDEYENSMGVNCLPEVTELLLRRAGELQLILTSHHPYVINNIPKRWWQVIRREGGVVRAVPASSIRRLDTASQQEAFIQLLGATEYAEGIDGVGHRTPRSSPLSSVSARPSRHLTAASPILTATPKM